MTQQTSALPDGTFQLTSSSQPVRVRSASSWVPVDLSLVRGPDGSWSPAKSPTPVKFSGGGSHDLSSIQGPRGIWASQGWSSGILPQPTVSGATLTYPEVLPGVDLALTATVAGFSEVLVVKSAAAAANPALDVVRLSLSSSTPLSARSVGNGMELSLASDSVSGTSDDGIFHVGGATWWDSTAPGAGIHGPGGALVESPLDATYSASQIALKTDAVTASNVVYPLYLDPSYSWTGGINGGTAYTYVDEYYPTASFWNGGHPDHLQHVGFVGKLNGAGSPDRTRAFWRMNTNGVAGKHILSAEFNTTEVYSYSCSAREVQLFESGGISSSTTWNSQPATGAYQSSANVAYGYSSSCAGHAVGFSALPAVTKAAAAKATYTTLQLRAADESDSYGWKKFNAAASLVILYNTPPTVPTNMSTSANTPCVTGNSRPSVGSLPALYARGSDPDGGNVALNFEWWNTAANTRVGSVTTGSQSSGTSFGVAIPGSAFADGAIVSWRVRTGDGTDNSAFTQWCEFRLDRSAPPTPRVSSPSTQFPDDSYRRTHGSTDADGNYHDMAPPLTVGQTGSFTFESNGAGDVTKYVYSLNGRPEATCSPSALGGSCSVSVSPGLPSSWIDVRSIDRANNGSGWTHYVFSLQPSSVLKAQWTIGNSTQWPAGRYEAPADGTWHNVPLTAASGSGGDPDRALTPEETAVAPAGTGPSVVDDGTGSFAAVFDGVNDYMDYALPSTTYPSALDDPNLQTDGSFSVVAEVKAAANGKYQTFLSQAGNVDSAFYLQMDPSGAFRFATTSADSTSRTAVVATASQSSILSVCRLQSSDSGASNYYDPNGFHTVIGVFDAPDNQIQIFIDNCSTPIMTSDGGSHWRARGRLIVGTAWQSSGPSAANMFAGRVRDVRLYYGAVTADQVMSQISPGAS